MTTPSRPGDGTPSPEASVAGCRELLESLLASGEAAAIDPERLAAAPAPVFEEALQAFTDAHAADALPALAALAGPAAPRHVRRAAKRALYRLAQRGVAAPAPTAARPVVRREPERPVRAWLSSIDGSGARATWILFEGGFGGRALCSLILSDTAGIVEVAGGDISKKRLEVELAALRADQKLPWVESDPTRAAGLVAEALRLHAEQGTTPPEGFARWQPLFESITPVEPPSPPETADPAQVERSAELLDRPEMAGWFLDPESVQADAVDLLAARESRLVVSDQVKAEREDTIVGRVIEREFSAPARVRWARRLLEMALLFDATDQPDPAATARAAAGALADQGRDPRHHPFTRALVRRALEIAGDVATGKLPATEVSRNAPTSPPPARPAARV